MIQPLERYLDHDNTNADGFAAAMLACQGYSPACSDAGGCVHGGSCFHRDGHPFAAKLINDLAALEPGHDTKASLRRAAALLIADSDEPQVQE